MEPAVLTLGGRLVSSLVGPLVRRLFVPGTAGAGLVDKPVRLADLVSFRGEKRTLGEADVRKLAAKLVSEAMASPGERPFPPDEEAAVTDTLARRLLALGDLDMDDVQAVRLGSHELAQELHLRAAPPDGLSWDACLFLDSMTQWACLHILEFFTRRSTFVARTLVEQTRMQSELIARVDELIARTPRPDARDTAFERRYLPYVAQQHNHITIYGIDLRDSPDRWPLEVAYLSLEATGDEELTGGPGPGLDTETTFSVHLPAEEALLAHDCVLLRGDAGSGKTTLVQWLAVTAARNGDRIPYVLPLRTLIRAGALPPPADFLSAVSCPLSPPEGWAERVLTAGRALVLVDGLDEIPAADRHRTRAWLLSLIHAFPGNQWLLTSRPTAVRPDWLTAEDFRELLLAPMRHGEVTTFVRRWHEAAQAPEYLAPLLDSLRTKRDLARLATNPLMCGLICALHRERRGYLPTGRKELYDAALTMLLTRRDRERGMGTVDDVDLGEEAQLEVLQRLAYALVLSGRTEMDVETAEGIVERCLPSLSVQGSATAVLRTLLLRSGLLRQPAEGVVDFVHRTFQDYLGARYAVEEGHLDVLAGHADDTQWEDVVRLAVAHARPRERAYLLEQLLALETPRLSLLALACLEHAPALDPAVRAEVEARAAALIPPRTPEEARTLAEAGPLVLELLPGPEGLADDEAEAVTATAAMVGTDAAMAVLGRFRACTADRVRVNLIRAWERFDPEAYATEVLAHVGTDDLYLFAESPEQVRALPLLGRRARLGMSGSYPLAHVLELLPDNVEDLGLADNALLHDLSPLASLRSLRRLTLLQCPGPIDFSPLADLGLLTVSLLKLGELHGLDRIATLEGINIGTHLPGGLAALPQDAPLKSISLTGDAIADSGLRRLSQWPGLNALDLRNDVATLGSADWAEVTLLPHLARLGVGTALIPAFADGPQLPTITCLYVTNVRESSDLTALAHACPHVRTVELYPDRVAAPLNAVAWARVFPDAEVTVEEPTPYLF
ncbi:NACHT domain-containing protein [Streptomyces sp. TRM68416]|uniref:NACHT domain-containing protein n=1 Tax=Streptomyces sp. TRM68416 TaxID=2758412 RepID=UPI001661C9F9|nr:NACHT domain-containing protein [Streptomyces sp. TRM68416]MBD0838950.1 NACHT domain-containing protein [Streptomyces sp. TRM68416]